MKEHHNSVDIDRLSVLSATILLAYALTRYVQIQPVDLDIKLFGILLLFHIDFKTIVSIIVGAMAATGSDWLIRDHPALVINSRDWKARIQHWILPMLTAWVIGVSLSNIGNILEWWIIFGMGGVLLVLVFIAEYSVVDVVDIQHPIASVSLTALSYALYLILVIAINAADFRLYLALPALAFAIWLVSIRTLYLQASGKWLFTWATVITLVTSQFAMAIHYLPLSPIRYGLLVLGLSYALTNLAGGLERHHSYKESLMEPTIMVILIWGLAFIFG